MATKKQRDEFRELIEDYLLSNNDRVRQLLDEGAARARAESLDYATASSRTRPSARAASGCWAIS
jgi:hypothetical protein